MQTPFKKQPVCQGVQIDMPLHILPNQSDWSDVGMSPLNKEEPDCKHDSESVDENVPVHGYRGNGSCFREEGEDEDNGEVEDREVVDWTTPFT
jgi:hypothetical protein